MISHRVRDMRKGRITKMSKNVERIYKEGKCRDCSVVVTRMDFAKILGKFTKVKIQYESSTTPKTKKDSQPNLNSSSRLKKSENGMVLVPKNAFNKHSINESTKKPRNTKPISTVSSPPPRQASNILKENNRLKRTPIVKDKNSNYNQQKPNLKRYGIIFINPNVNNNNDTKSKSSLLELLPDINKSILPTDEWAIDYFPKSDEPKEDKVYDRIAAELEDLMYNEKVSNSEDKADPSDNKADDFPSIMDILNESTPNSISKPTDQSTTFKSNLESSDVEAMLLGKSNADTREPETMPMDVENSDMANLIGEVGPLDTIPDTVKSQEANSKSGESIVKDCIPNLSNPSIIDETLQKGIQEQLIFDNTQKVINEEKTESSEDKVASMDTDVPADKKTKCESDSVVPKTEVVTHVIFKQTVDGKCHRCVTCPKNLKYSIELNGKSVEFIGAPKFISSLEDLKVLLQIVNEAHLESLYVLH